MSIQRPWVTPEEIRSVAYGLFLGEDEAAELEGPIRFAENKILAKKALRVEQRLRAGTLDVETVKGMLQQRIDDQVAGGAWYPESIEGWKNNSRVVSNGNCVMMIAYSECDAVVEAFNALF